jgi:hypothetical protein
MVMQNRQLASHINEARGTLVLVGKWGQGGVGGLQRNYVAPGWNHLQSGGYCSALCARSHAIYRAGVRIYTRASAHARIEGLCPSADIE